MQLRVAVLKCSNEIISNQNLKIIYYFNFYTYPASSYHIDDGLSTWWWSFINDDGDNYIWTCPSISCNRTFSGFWFPLEKNNTLILTFWSSSFSQSLSCYLLSRYPVVVPHQYIARHHQWLPIINSTKHSFIYLPNKGSERWLCNNVCFLSQMILSFVMHCTLLLLLLLLF